MLASLLVPPARLSWSALDAGQGLGSVRANVDAAGKSNFRMTSLEGWYAQRVSLPMRR